jgi:hypothetical protein
MQNMTPRRFPVFPVETGKFFDFLPKPSFGHEKCTVNQSLASEFPLPPEPGISAA